MDLMTKLIGDDGKVSGQELMHATKQTQILVCTAMHNISYIRGLFPDMYFCDHAIPETDMTVKKLMPISTESSKLIEWTEKGMSDALQNKYLKTLIFCIWDESKGLIEEYTFSFDYPTREDEVIAIQMTCKGRTEQTAKFKSDETKVTTDKTSNMALMVLLPEAECYIVASNDRTAIYSEQFEGKQLGILEDTEEKSMELVHVQMSHKFDKVFEGSNINDSLSHVPGHTSIYSDTTKTKPVETTIKGSINENKETIHGYLCCVSSRNAEFFLDSGAVYHICRDRFCLQNFKKLPEKDYVELSSIDREKFVAKHKGDIIYHNIKVHDVLFTRKIGFNVISVSQLDKQGLMTCIGGGKFSIHNVQKSCLVAEGYLNTENNDYTFRTMNWCLPKKDRTIVFVEGDQPEEFAEYNEEEWVIDCLCARHMVPKLNLLSEVVSETESCSFRSATGTTIKGDQKGRISMRSIAISDVLHCPTISQNLLSVGQLDKSGYAFTFFNSRCQIQRRFTLEDVGYGILDGVRNRYMLIEFTEKSRSHSLQHDESQRVSKKRRTQ